MITIVCSWLHNLQELIPTLACVIYIVLPKYVGLNLGYFNYYIAFLFYTATCIRTYVWWYKHQLRMYICAYKLMVSILLPSRDETMSIYWNECLLIKIQSQLQF